MLIYAPAGDLTELAKNKKNIIAPNNNSKTSITVVFLFNSEWIWKHCENNQSYLVANMSCWLCCFLVSDWPEVSIFVLCGTLCFCTLKRKTYFLYSLFYVEIQFKYSVISIVWTQCPVLHRDPSVPFSNYRSVYSTFCILLYVSGSEVSKSTLYCLTLIKI